VIVDSPVIVDVHLNGNATVIVIGAALTPVDHVHGVVVRVWCHDIADRKVPRHR